MRSLIRDALHGFSTFSVPDVDLAYFDAVDPSRERGAELRRRLATLLAGVPWEVTNRAAVHRWFEGRFGYAPGPLSSLEEAVASWPEFATPVGLALRPDEVISVIAPHGLEDIFSVVVRRNPDRVSAAIVGGTFQPAKVGHHDRRKWDATIGAYTIERSRARSADMRLDSAARGTSQCDSSLDRVCCQWRDELLVCTGEEGNVSEAFGLSSLVPAGEAEDRRAMHDGGVL